MLRLGIVTTGVETQNMQKPVGIRTGYLMDISKAAAVSGHQVFVFDPGQVNWKSGQVQGVILLKDNGNWVWKAQDLPLPGVIYNRIPTRLQERSPVFQTFVSRAKTKKIPIFNPAFFSKDHVYQLLEQSAARRFLPETRKGIEPEFLRSLLLKYSTAYLKPAGGSSGIGVVRVRHLLHENTWRVEYGAKDRFRSVTCDSFAEVMNWVQKITQHKSYITQQGIQLRTIGNRPVDFRVHLNRNRTGAWVTTGVSAKISGDRAVTTNVKNGGVIQPPLDVFTQWYGNAGEERLQKFCDCAVEMAALLGVNSQNRLGELGIDMGIDHREQVWIFEANSKPGRVIFKHPGLRAQGKRSASMVLEFAEYLQQEKREVK